VIRRTGTRLLAAAWLALAAEPLPAAEPAARTYSFSPEGGRGSFPGTVRLGENEITCDLASLPAGARVLLAVLRVKREPAVGANEIARKPVRIVTGGDKVLALRAPRFNDFDATLPVRAAGPRGTVKLVVEHFPGWKREETRLDVTVVGSMGGPALAPHPASAGSVEAWHREGDTFITWREARPILAAEALTMQELREARGAAMAGPEIRHRIWRSRDPIRPGTLERAELLDEVDALTAWNLDRYGNAPRPEWPALRYCIRDGEPPLPPGGGVYVHRAREPGRFHYAVTSMVDGQEDLSSIGDQGSQSGPVDEAPGPGAPILQRVDRPGVFQFVEGPELRYYVRWESPPTANVPSRPLDYLVGIPRNVRYPAVLQVALHCWGGSMEDGYGWWYRADEGAMLAATNQVPYDWWAAYHENLSTLRSFEEGKVRSYSPLRVWAFVEWMRSQWRIDENRIFLAGNSMGGAGVSNWLRHGERFAYGISWVGVHIPLGTPQFLSSYEQVLGKADWKIPHESGLAAFDEIDGARWLRSNPAAETPFLAYSNGKNDIAIGWAQAVEFTRALQETRRPHIFVWGQEGHGQRAYFPTATGGGDNVKQGLDIRLDRPLPAFTRCSLDDEMGTGEPQNGAPSGQLNLYLRWDPGTIVDAPDRHEVEVYLIPSSPAPEAVTDLTPRRLRAFKPAPGSRVAWTSASRDGKELQKGELSVDATGLLTVEKLVVGRDRRRVVLRGPGR
jgi:hypothetical protein